MFYLKQQKCLAKISIADKMIYNFFYCWWVEDVSFQSPLVSPCLLLGTLSKMSKHRLSNAFSQHQSNSQAELSRPTKEDFTISKRKWTRSLSDYILIYQSSLQCDFCIPNHLVTRPVSKGRASPPLKKCLGHIVCITIVFVHAIDVKFGPEQILRPLGVPSWLRVCWWLLPYDFCQLCHSAQSFHNQIFQA